MPAGVAPRVGAWWAARVPTVDQSLSRRVEATLAYVHESDESQGRAYDLSVVLGLPLFPHWAVGPPLIVERCR